MEWLLVLTFISICSIMTRFLYLQHSTIEAVLNRGEKLDDLVEKSEGLSLQSKAFYKTVSCGFKYSVKLFQLILKRQVHVSQGPELRHWLGLTLNIWVTFRYFIFFLTFFVPSFHSFLLFLPFVPSFCSFLSFFPFVSSFHSFLLFIPSFCSFHLFFPFVPSLYSFPLFPLPFISPS